MKTTPALNREATSLSLLMKTLSLGCLSVCVAAIGSEAYGQQADTNLNTNQETIVASQQAVIRYSGQLGSPSETNVATPANSTAKVVDMQFTLYSAASGGEALWTETQPVKVAADGSYTVLLGAASLDGIPATLFPSGGARYLEAHPVSESVNSSASGRSLLAAVPYAYRSVDADTLAGRAATDYLTREDFQQSLQAAFQGAISPALIHPTPEIAGTGTANTLTLWTNSTTLGNSIITESGTNIGISTTTPATTLDVNGNTTIRGSVILPSNGPASASAGTSSHSIQFTSDSYSSTTKASVDQTFKWQAFPVSNDTSAPSASLELLFGANGSTPVATGLSIAPSGKITFAPGQTFPGGGGSGTITGITTTSPLTGSGTSGSVAIGLNTATLAGTLESTYNNLYARLGSTNKFTGQNTFTNGATFGAAISGQTSEFSASNTGFGSVLEVTNLGSLSGSSAIYAENDSTGGEGIYIEAYGNRDSSNNYPVGVDSFATNGTGVFGTSGAASSHGSTFSKLEAAGVWGDTNHSYSDGQAYAGVVGTADDNWAGYFINGSTSNPTLNLYNTSGGSTGLFKTLAASTPDGVCGIGDKGNLACTGQIKTLVSTHSGEHTVETYSVQSPENWMEDFGSASLDSGAVIVRIDPEFAETISNSADYRIFLTPNGDSKGLYVTNKTPTSFEVRESGGGTASIAFDYRIVARRRGYEMQRMADVTETFKAETKAVTEFNKKK